jgi:FkbM family methyltransferase
MLSLRGLGVLNFEGKYLSGEKAWLKSYLEGKDSPVVLDIGANIGDYSNDAFKANLSARVYAFEPHPETYSRLCVNMNKISPQLFKSYNLGVGHQEDTLELFDYANKSGSAHASLYKEVITDLHEGEVKSWNVDIVKLDNFLEAEFIEEVDLLKIDTEGNEYNVLLGAGEFLTTNKIKALHIEFNEMNVVSGVNFKKFWDLLPNYNFYRILPGGKLLPIKRYSPILCEIYAYQNIIATLKKN